MEECSYLQKKLLYSCVGIGITFLSFLLKYLMVERFVSNSFIYTTHLVYMPKFIQAMLNRAWNYWQILGSYNPQRFKILGSIWLLMETDVVIIGWICPFLVVHWETLCIVLQMSQTVNDFHFNFRKRLPAKIYFWKGSKTVWKWSLSLSYI